MPATGEPAAPPSLPAPEPDDDWPAQAADSIVDLVGRVRDKTTGPAITAARGIVFGLLIAVVAVIGVTALVIGLVRLTQVLLEYQVDRATAVWLSYLIVGALFAIVGLVLWRLANRKAVEPLVVEPTPQ